ncbi:MAG: radical SAM protein [Crocinitomicaceae bacterium]|nr:radical SAM protein [Crocinitomicaceae bacterium]|tara:strand:- start:5442 stop:6953 length:1512 start_codon:yes stop_codon:yes gene_type:complete
MSKSKKIILFNPKAATYGYRIPNSILQVAASIHDKYQFVLIDGNREDDSWSVIEKYLSSGEFGYFCSTVMPGPQLKQAIPFSKRIKERFNEMVVIWGGYFASNQYQSALDSGFVDYIIDGPGDVAFPALLDSLGANKPIDEIKNLIFKDASKIIKGPREALLNQDQLPSLPYDVLHRFYSIPGYLKRTYLGRKTMAYHSSMGCPFSCSFCAVVPIYNARWKAKSADLVYRDVKYLKEEYGADSVEFHDNNFFTSEKRVVEFSKLMLEEGMNWWGEGRIDTINKYSDESLALMRKSGCKMIFLGAETGNDEVLKQMNKGGTQTGQQILDFAARLRKFDIIPEYSFVLGMPADTPQQVMRQIDSDIAFIKEVKRINPDAEIIIYLYSPVPTEGSELFEAVKNAGFSFPEKLEDWLDPSWENFDLRKNPLTPWLTPKMVDKIRNFETVVNGRYPTYTDPKITPFQRKAMGLISSFRYKNNLLKYPYEIKALQKFWLKYRQPEIEGF